MLAKFKWVLQVFSLELRRRLAYRVGFWVQFLGNISMTLATSYFLWDAIFSSTGKATIGGFSFYKMVLYYIVVRFIQQMLEGFESSDIQQDIYTGQLNRYIIYPVSLILWKYAANLARLVIYAQQLLASIVIYLLLFPVPADVAISLKSVSMFLGALLIAGLIHYLFTFSVGLIAFWVEQVWTLVVMFRFVGALAGGAIIPLALFPRWCSAMLDYLPFKIIFTFPVQALFGELSWHIWLSLMLQGLAWSCVVYLIASVLLYLGKYRYTGVGI